MRGGWQNIINTVYQNAEKWPEFINVLIIFGICILSLLDLGCLHPLVRLDGDW